MAKDQKMPLWAQCGHRKPRTRREMLASGVLGFASTVTLPSLGLWSKNVLAAPNCPAPTMPNGMIPFISVQLSGGAAMSANFLPMDQGGQPLPSYSRMGLGDGNVPIETEFGGAKFAGRTNAADANSVISKFLVGMRETMGTANTNTSFVGLCVRSRDDNDTNVFDPTGLLLHSGYQGSLMPHLDRGNKRSLPAQIAPPAPLNVSSVEDMEKVLTFSGALNNAGMNDLEKVKMAEMIAGLNSRQLSKLNRYPSGAATKDLFECAGIRNKELISQGGGDTNPFREGHAQRAAFETLWGDQQLFGAMAYNNLLGQSGPAYYGLGGYDYHNGTRNTGDQRDEDAGRLVGRLLASAEILGRPLFIMVYSDGAAGSPESTDRAAPWTTDFGRTGAMYMLAYNPAGRPTVSTNQIGHFTAAQASDDKFIVGDDPERATMAVFANYCSLIGRMDLLESLPRRPFEASEIEQVLAFRQG